MMEAGRLAGRTAVVTGAAGGLGLATARLFAAEGARVIAVDRETMDFKDAAAIVPEQGDVADEGFIAAVVARHPDADILVAHAAISRGGGVGATDRARWSEVLEVNVVAVAAWVRTMLPAMRRSGRGAIVTVGSQLALAGGRNNASYIASKGAIMALTRSIALDHAAEGIRCNCVVPGAIETPLLRRSFARAADPAAAEEASRARHPLGRFGRADEVAAAALFLASEAASFTTGAILPVDGGWLVG